MPEGESWEQRVAEWKASGLSARAFCEDKPFTAGGLRHMAFRLRQRRPPAPEQTVVPLARVVVKRSATSRARAPGATSAAPPPVPEPLLVEVGGVRVMVRRGFDHETLAAVVDVLAARGGLR